MFFPLFAIVSLGVLGIGMKSGLRRAIMLGWLPVSLALPVWMTAQMGSLTLDLRLAAGLAIVAVAILNPPASGLGRWTLADSAMAMLLLGIAISQYNAGSLRPLTMPEIAKKWLLPYLAGRWALGSTTDIPKASRLVVGLLVVIAGLAVFEAGAKINPINKVLGKTYDLLEEGEGYRWGMKRAHVLFDHPIFFGMALVLLLPWTLEASRLARTGAGPRWWRFAPWIVAAALFTTVSRGPQLAALGTTAFYFFFRLPRLRLPMAILAVVLGTLAYTGKDAVVAALGKAAGEKAKDITFIFIEGEEVEYTGTNHRVLLFRVYDRAISEAGLFGFGTEMKGVELEESIAQRFGSIDCHYLLFLLQHGWVGVGSFLILTLTILLKLVGVAWRVERPQAALAAGMLGALFAVAVLLISVWFSPDFAAVWLFSAGMASRLRSLSSPAKNAGPNLARRASIPTSRPSPRLAHAPIRPLTPVPRNVLHLTHPDH